MLVTNKLQYQPPESAQVECARLPDTLRATYTHELTSAHVLQKVSVYFLPFTLHGRGRFLRSVYSIFLFFSFLRSLDIDFNFDFKIIERAITLATSDVSQCFCNQVKSNNMINCAHIVQSG